MKNYTCNDYRQEMMLAGLRKRLAQDSLSGEERKQLEIEILKLEKQLGID